MISLKNAAGRDFATIKGGRLVLSSGGAEYLARRGRLDLPKLATLSELPDGLSVRHLNLSGCSNLAQLPEGLRVRHLNLADCSALTELPSGLACYEINLSGTQIQSLPADLRVEYRLELTNCTKLVKLPDGLRVGSLVLRGCRALGSLPEGLDVNFLDLRGCEGLTDWPKAATIRIGRLSMSGCRRLGRLPDGLGRVAQLDVSDCTSLKSLPEGLEIGTSIEIANTAITALPASMAGVSLLWRGVPIDARIAFDPDSIEVGEVLEEENAERRRVLLERVGLERFLSEAKVEVLDADQDPGGHRRLLRVPLEGDEDLVCVMVHCPSTGGRYLLRVPPSMETCRQAVAWTAGFDDPSLYRPLVET